MRPITTLSITCLAARVDKATVLQRSGVLQWIASLSIEDTGAI